jgi:hypothetical protein
MADETGIDGFFGDISYNKGASVIRMLVPAFARVLFNLLYLFFFFF